MRKKGTGGLDSYGYMEHGSNGRRVKEHIMVAEKALGKRLPNGAIVHHHDEDKTNNVPSNLVICQDRAYHNLIHQRMRALDACGHADWLKCEYCGQYDSPENLSKRRSNRSGQFHLACARAYNNSRYQARKAA